ncbi:type VI secretion system baseplate subunit TssG [Alteromonas sp. a30]|uniref:type VI secretion system baseplate subunit TssG n=1 Tax=Alteromonas sp. a30 TaxID=2730917 RepID=UPI00228099EA|nr:type VI secretion system baseplate subunit TssG [Alteromonas sp. a30]MCY7293841.1 type VI secretion system baseplate subunit TssG [Alteromonas sp. a30]
METHQRSQKAGVDFLTSQAEELNFYQAIRLLENQASGGAVSDNLCFQSVNTQAFTPNSIAGIQFDAQQTQVRVNSFGLLGQQSPLPDIFAEIIQRASEAGNKGPEAFLNLFNHRFIRLLFDIKKELDPMLFSERPQDSALYKLALALLGLWTDDMHVKLPVDLLQLLSFCTLFFGTKQNYSSLKRVIESLLKCEATIEPCAGAWQPLPKQYQAQLDADNCILGSGIGLGKRYWDNQAGIDLALKMPSLTLCEVLLPQGEKHNVLVALLSYLTDGRYQINVTMSAPWSTVPLSELPENPVTNEEATSPTSGALMRLGNTSWLKSESPCPTLDGEYCVYPVFVVKPSLAHNFNEADL